MYGVGLRPTDRVAEAERSVAAAEANNAALMLSFLNKVFVEQGARSVAGAELVERLDDAEPHDGGPSRPPAFHRWCPLLCYRPLRITSPLGTVPTRARGTTQ